LIETSTIPLKTTIPSLKSSSSNKSTARKNEENSTNNVTTLSQSQKSQRKSTKNVTPKKIKMDGYQNIIILPNLMTNEELILNNNLHEESRMKEFANISKIITLENNMPEDMFLMQKGDTTLLSALHDKTDDFFNFMANTKGTDIKIDILEYLWNCFSKYGK